MQSHEAFEMTERPPSTMAVTVEERLEQALPDSRASLTSQPTRSAPVSAHQASLRHPKQLGLDTEFRSLVAAGQTVCDNPLRILLAVLGSASVLAAIVAVVPAFYGQFMTKEGLELAKWTAWKDYRDECLERKVSLSPTRLVSSVFKLIRVCHCRNLVRLLQHARMLSKHLYLQRHMCLQMNQPSSEPEGRTRSQQFRYTYTLLSQ